MSSHSGTHIDFPAHFLKNGQTCLNYSIDNFIKTAHVVEINNNHHIDIKELVDLKIDNGDAILFKTINSSRDLYNIDSIVQDYVYLSDEGASYCIKKQVSLIGIDYLSVDDYNNHSYSVHKLLFENNILILECIDLSHVPNGKYKLICLPLKIENAEASPVRAILIKE